MSKKKEEPTKACPFCGEIPQEFGEGPNHDNKVVYWITCFNRKCTLRVTTYLQDTPEAAKAIWNKRVEP